MTTQGVAHNGRAGMVGREVIDLGVGSEGPFLIADQDHVLLVGTPNDFDDFAAKEIVELLEAVVRPVLRCHLANGAIGAIEDIRVGHLIQLST